MRGLTAIQAYKKSATHRSIREQEAGVFQLVNATLRSAKGADSLATTKALADNERLWITVMDLLSDPSNKLQVETRASLLSIGRAVRREINQPEPDFTFLIGINEQVAAGLSGL